MRPCGQSCPEPVLSPDVAQGLAAGERAQGVGGRELADPAGVDACVLAEGPTDPLAEEEVGVGQVGEDALGEEAHG